MKQSDLAKLVLSLNERVGKLEARTTALENNMPTPAPPTKKAPRTRKKKGPVTPTIDVTKLDEMSHSELVSACRLLGHADVSRQIPPEDLQDLILGEPITVLDPLLEARRVIHEFVSGNTALMHSSLKCDLKCLSCPHDQVMECFADNADLVSSQR